MLDFFMTLQDNKLNYLMVVLSLILSASTFDFLFGWINARFNKNVVFQSNVALYGIIKKIMYFIALILFMFVAFTFVPLEVAFPSVIILSGGYLLSELNSILSHLDLTSDGKEGELFRTFLTRIFKDFNNK